MTIDEAKKYLLRAAEKGTSYIPLGEVSLPQAQELNLMIDYSNEGKRINIGSTVRYPDNSFGNELKKVSNITRAKIETRLRDLLLAGTDDNQTLQVKGTYMEPLLYDADLFDVINQALECYGWEMELTIINNHDALLFTKFNKTDEDDDLEW